MNKTHKNPAAGEVGIFWIYGNQLIQNSIPWRDTAWVDIDGDHVYDFPVDHYRYWGRLKKHIPAIAGLEYDGLPRGRVIYKIPARIFYIYVPESIIIGRKDKRDLIKKEFSLVGKVVVFKSDPHY
jgi:hypothetical protein